MEAVVVHRVQFLDYFCPKQGQDFKPSVAPIYPNMGKVPPSGILGSLFVIGVEFLSNAIRRLEEIEDIQIDPNKSIKITQYADDTMVFVKDIRSVPSLFDLLQQFENCSGLQINQSKSEILWLHGIIASVKGFNSTIKIK